MQSSNMKGQCQLPSLDSCFLLREQKETIPLVTVPPIILGWYCLSSMSQEGFMPVQPVPTDGEEMEAEGDSAIDANEEEEDETGEDPSDSGSETEPDEESSEMDDEDCERRRLECLDEMSDLEKHFLDLKDKLFKEKLNQVRTKLEEVIAEKAIEYIEPLAALQKNMKIRTEVAGNKLLLFVYMLYMIQL
ncbi:BRM1L protein, partial [Polypterus senegalus]